MTTTLDDIAESLEGLIPASMTTVDAAGVPNVIHLSRVEYVDGDHIALSHQFFRKTARNLAENPRACILVSDPKTYRMCKLHARLVREETAGPVFERMQLRIEIIAQLSGMSGVFRLEAACIFRVIRVEEVEGGLLPNRLEGT